MECRHLDGDRSNNAPSNLRWGTRRENALDRKRHGTHNTKLPPNKGETNPMAKFTADDIRLIRRLAGEGMTRSELAVRFQTSSLYIGEIVNRKRWKDIA